MFQRLVCALLLWPIVLAAKDTDFSMEADGFALIHTFSLTSGKICRKLDHHDSPAPLAWHIRDEWNSIHLDPLGKTSKMDSEALSELQGGCQRGISQNTLIGPLKKGKWQIYGIQSISVGKIVNFNERLEVKTGQNGYEFTTEMPTVVAVTVQYYSNTTGKCREFAPLILRAENEARTQLSTIHAAPAVLHTARKHLGETCRALPQTISEGALEVPPGRYRVLGNNIKRVNIYRGNKPAESAKNPTPGKS